MARILVTAFGAAILLLAAPAVHAQGQPFGCSVSVADSRTLRADGVTDLLPDVVLSCSGGSGGTALANLTLTLNTNVTSRKFGTKNEALFLVGAPAIGAWVPDTNVFQGT